MIYWIQDRTPPQLAIVARPRGGEWLRDDLARLRAGGIDMLVSLLPVDEEWALGLSDESSAAEEFGMQFLRIPVPDREVPADAAGFRRLVAGLAGQVRAGERIGVHCRACIGRSSVLLASVMIALGREPQQALEQIAAARGFEVPDTPEQRMWILNFSPEP